MSHHFRPIFRGSGLAILLALMALCSGCSSFDARWKTAGAGGQGQQWDGRWTSDSHKTGSGGAVGGRLRAVLEPMPGGALQANIKANWLIFASGYSMTFQPKTRSPRRAGVQEYSGSHDLPKIFGGTYRYEATLAGDQFRATYDSSYDRGKFTMTRVQPPKDYGPVHPRH